MRLDQKFHNLPKDARCNCHQEAGRSITIPVKVSDDLSHGMTGPHKSSRAFQGTPVAIGTTKQD